MNRNVPAILLCGGRSSRMQQPKHLLPWGDRTLLEHMLSVLQSVCDPVHLVAGPTTELPTGCPANVRIVRDEVEYAGPLSGLMTGLAALDRNAPAAFVTACDLPFLTPAIIQRFNTRLAAVDTAATDKTAAHTAGVDAEGIDALVVVDADQRLHPLTGVYRRTALEPARELFARGNRRMLDLLEMLNVVQLPLSEFADLDPTGMFLRNLNSPADYAAARRSLSTVSSPPAANPAVPPPGTATP